MYAEKDKQAQELIRKTSFRGDAGKNEMFEEYFYNSEEETKTVVLRKDGSVVYNDVFIAEETKKAPTSTEQEKRKPHEIYIDHVMSNINVSLRVSLGRED